VSDPLVSHPLHDFIGQVVVLDTQGPLIYLGTLTQVLPHHILLTDADVHDSNDSRATKDLYLIEARDLGVRMNRKRVMVAAAQIASASLLSDITD
jgi:hypothetical protein